MSKIKVNDLTVYYEISGNGSPLVLLPGMLGTIESNWRRFIPALAQHYRTIAIDLRGHGGTDNPAPSGKAGIGELIVDQMEFDEKIRSKLKKLIQYEGSEWQRPVADTLPKGSDPITAKLKKSITSLVIEKFFQK